jgi:hypothetical protein
VNGVKAPRPLLAAAAVALATLGAAAWVGLRAGDPRAIDAGRVAPATTGAPAVTPTGAREPGDASLGSTVATLASPLSQGSAANSATASPRVVRGSVSAARTAFEQARNLGSVYNALKDQSDPDALFFAERALRECMSYITAASRNGAPPPLDRYRPAPPGEPLTVRREAAYAALQARCSGFDLGTDPATAMRSLRDAMLAANDPRSALERAAQAVRRGGAPQGAMEEARKLGGDGDPYVLEQAGALMSALRGRYVFVLDGEMVRPEIVAAGWMMAACDAGRSCGDEWVQSPCAFLSECDAHDLASSMQRYQLTPAEYDLMLRVRLRVSQGVTSGQWDATLFDPQPAPPRYRRWGP